MRLVLLGAPGSGKGTQAARLKTALGVPHISTGDMLRAAVAAGTAMGLKAKAVMDSGQLVSDDILLGMLEERLAQADAKAGFILDGYPRNLVQADALDHMLAKLGQPLNAVIKLDVPNEAIIGRCEIRYKAEGRADDNPDTVRKRLAIYAEQTAPVADFYASRGKLQVVDGVGELSDVTARVQQALQNEPAAANG
ncbi:adenylate kinase [Rhodanobacter sp. AS-Z3]|uniref:adenylate kinase n=1 Tax=Rhodanobacter sp. AS-Z3 TaxID=3031330 RepID=UPI00247B2B9E|nr:adenylate kinase [Rhodanobacter sp. AS-Z3]WEN15144.1 adenylate kinase [Rhodanobacter sp. AS-Z3]